MRPSTESPPFEIFSTCPASSMVDGKVYLQNVMDVARWSDACGYKGILVYADNSQVDPWLISQIILQNTRALCPLVAVQPVYMHPYSVAKMVTSLAHLYGRRLYLNMVAGGFRNDLAALNDSTPHDKRYGRLIEYTTIIKALLATPSPVSYEGVFYRIDKLSLSPALPSHLLPGIFVSGSSEAGMAAAKAMGATAVKYPKPAAAEAISREDAVACGIRVGIIARKNEEEAWTIALARFPENRKGQFAHQLAMKTSDSVWHRQLSQLAQESEERKSPYWLVPFENYKTFCPYLVGSYERVAGELGRYMAAGYRAFILDIPPDEEELRHSGVAFTCAVEEMARC